MKKYKRLKICGGATLLDKDDYFRFKKYKWHMSKSKNHSIKYVRKGFYDKENRIIYPVFIHHAIMGKPLHGLVVDHINGNGLDNRRKNLRIVTVRENMSNRKDRREGRVTSKYVGVSYDKKNKKWRANIQINNKIYNLGRHETEEEANNIYKNRVKELAHQKT